MVILDPIFHQIPSGILVIGKQSENMNKNSNKKLAIAGNICCFASYSQLINLLFGNQNW